MVFNCSVVYVFIQKRVMNCWSCLNPPPTWKGFLSTCFFFSAHKFCFWSFIAFFCCWNTDKPTNYLHLFHSLETDEGVWVFAEEVKGNNSRNSQIIAQTFFKNQILFPDFTLFVEASLELGFRLPRTLGIAKSPPGEHPRNNPLFSVENDSLFFAITIAKEELSSERFSVDVAQGNICFFLFLLFFCFAPLSHRPSFYLLIAVF